MYILSPLASTAMSASLCPLLCSRCNRPLQFRGSLGNSPRSEPASEQVYLAWDNRGKGSLRSR